VTNIAHRGPGRRRNARGQGARLGREIVDGALAIIERTGSEEAVTLRSVAREVGIAAPSIYAHFADRDAILWAVVQAVFDELYAQVAAADEAAGPDPVDRLVAGCEAYVDFGLEHPARYRVVFAREFPPGEPPLPEDAPTFPGDDAHPAVGARAFSLLVDGIADCMAAGASSSTDPVADATAVWVGLHGTVSLWSTMCEFPWPEQRPFVRSLVLALARVDPAYPVGGKVGGGRRRPSRRGGAPGGSLTGLRQPAGPA
jgi:AcrR family transcriptional regulator